MKYQRCEQPVLDWRTRKDRACKFKAREQVDGKWLCGTHMKLVGNPVKCCPACGQRLPSKKNPNEQSIVKEDFKG